MVVTVRTDDLESSVPTVRLLAELERSAWVERIELGPLGRSDVAALLRSLDREGSIAEGHGRPRGTNRRQPVLRRATRGGGGPRDRSTSCHPGCGTCWSTGSPALPDATRRVLRAASAAGRRVDDELLAPCSRSPSRAVADALRPAVSHGMLVDAEAVGDGLGGYAFRHALLAEVAYSELLHGERDRLHAGFGLELERRGEIGGVPVTPAELAYHWVAARDHERAIPALIRPVRRPRACTRSPTREATTNAP